MTLRQDLIIPQYADWSFTYVHKDGTGAVVDLTGYSAAMSIKRQPGQTAVPRSYLSSGADANGGTITLGTSDGTVTLAMTAQQTKQLLWDFDLWALIETGRADAVIKPESHLVYDLALTHADGKVTRAIEGRVIVRRSVTP
jgi:hypothetical protein